MTRSIRKPIAGLIGLVVLRGGISFAATADGLPPVVPEPTVAAARTMHHDDPVIHLALTVLGQVVNPITVATPEEIRRIYARRRAGTPPSGLNAFRMPVGTSDPNIYVNRESDMYSSAARKPSALALLKLAATLVHEQVHNTDGEYAAYRLQSDFVRSRLNSLPRREHEDARRYLTALDGRADGRALAERMRRARRASIR